jgi:hypothetical protein
MGVAFGAGAIVGAELHTAPAIGQTALVGELRGQRAGAWPKPTRDRKLVCTAAVMICQVDCYQGRTRWII